MFGSEPDGEGSPSEEQAPPPPPPRSPEENAKPPVPGEPIVGVFVSSSKGKDDGFGTNDRPLRTLAQGIALAKKQGQKVVACAETFDEDVELVDGVSMYGSFDCSTTEWKVVDRRAVVHARSNVAVKAIGVASATRVEGFELHSADAADGADGVEGAQNAELGAPDGLPSIPQGLGCSGRRSKGRRAGRARARAACRAVREARAVRRERARSAARGSPAARSAPATLTARRAARVDEAAPRA